MRFLTYHKIYGLTFKSQITLHHTQSIKKCENPDVTIFCSEKLLIEPEVDPGTPWFTATRNSVEYRIKGVGHFKITNGDKIVITKFKNSDPDTIRLFLFGSAFSALLQQRGFLVLHANAIVIDTDTGGNKVILIAGDSGAGKSTTAGAFIKKGYQVLADDVSPIDCSKQIPMFLPGPAKIKIWNDVAGPLGVNTDDLERVQQGYDKFFVPLEIPLASAIQKPLPIAKIYILKKASDFTLTPVLQSNKFVALRANALRNYFLDAQGLQGQQLHQCTKLAAHCPISEVTRPQPCDPFQLADLIESDYNATRVRTNEPIANFDAV